MLALSFFVPFIAEYEFSRSIALTLPFDLCSLTFWSHRIICSRWGHFSDYCYLPEYGESKPGV